MDIDPAYTWMAFTDPEMEREFEIIEEAVGYWMIHREHCYTLRHRMVTYRAYDGYDAEPVWIVGPGEDSEKVCHDMPLEALLMGGLSEDTAEELIKVHWGTTCNSCHR